MKTLAVNAVKSNNSYINFAGKNKKPAVAKAVYISAGALTLAGSGVAVYKNRFNLLSFANQVRKSFVEFKLNMNGKFMHLNTVKWLGSY